MKVQRPKEPRASNLSLIIARCACNASDQSKIRGDGQPTPRTSKERATRQVANGPGGRIPERRGWEGGPTACRFQARCRRESAAERGSRGSAQGSAPRDGAQRVPTG